MILSFLYISIAFFIVPASVYLFYYAVTFKKGQNVPNLEKLDDSDLPKISIVIPAYNEEKVIENRIKNLGDVYPKDKFEVVLSNDGSTDRTEEIAKDTFERYGITGKVISNKRSGVNNAINLGIGKSTQDIIFITGADGYFDKDTIPNMMSVLLADPEVGGVTGDLIPIIKEKSVFSSSESAYRSIYGRICQWESGLYATFCFNGPVVAYKRDVISGLNPTKGADDASMALSVIKQGYMTKYVSDAKFYEYAPSNFKEQRRQKIRRSTRLMQAIISNLDVFKTADSTFRFKIFPLRILMFFICPLLFFISVSFFGAFLLSFSLLSFFLFILGLFFIVYVNNIRENLLSSFVIYQSYLLIGLFNLIRDVHIWEPTERVGVKKEEA